MGTTANYGWEYPDDGGDADTWGAIHTAMVQAIDAKVKEISDAALTAANNAAPTGAVQDFFRTTAPTGWIVLSGTIGNASSNADYANAAAQALFLQTWAQFDNTICPIYTSAGSATTRGVSAAADWAANKRLSLTDQPDKFRRSYKSGGNSAAIGVVQAQEIQSHTHTFPISNNDSNGPYAANAPDTSGGTSTTNSTGGTETRPTNIAYLTCIKL